MTSKKLPLIDKNMIVPFWLLTSCFVVWGLAQDLTAPMVTAFKGIFTMSTFEASLVQFAYFGAYFALALPTAFLNQRFGYKVGVLTGLGLAAIGAFGFYPAAKSLTFGVFLIALFILAAGLSVLETSANPFAIAMGPEGTATRRLNLAQSFNPLGTNLGVLLAAVLVLPKMNPATPEQRATMPRDQLVTIQTAELNAIMNPYLGLAVFLVIIWVGIFIKKVPRSHEEVASDSHHLHFGDTVRRLHHNHHWRYGVLAQFFNVGAQVCTWTYIVLYVAEVVPGGTAVQGAYFLQVSLILFFRSEGSQKPRGGRLGQPPPALRRHRPPAAPQPPLALRGTRPILQCRSPGLHLDLHRALCRRGGPRWHRGPGCLFSAGQPDPLLPI